MFVSYVNNPENRLRREHESNKRLVAKVAKAGAEKAKQEIGVGQDPRSAEERPTPHTCNSEASGGCLADPEL
tara:strand:+ start:66 stop:281 length:216 start_codon:yes stop_codon:yes gene_type:complete